MKMCWQAVIQGYLLYGLQVSRMSCQQASQPEVCKDSRNEGQSVRLNTNCQGGRVASLLACRHVS